MRGTSTILINGRHYDTVTGLPVDRVASKKPAASKSAETSTKITVKTVAPSATRSITAKKPHKPRHSMTLRRDLVKKPSGPQDHAAKNTRQHIAVTRSPQIAKFAPHPEMKKKPVSPVQADAHSAVVTAAHKKFAAAQQTRASKPKALSSRELKEHLIASKLAEAQPNKKLVKAKKNRMPQRVSSVMAACFAVMLLGGYLSYINMPNLSVRVAAAQAGVDATYPTYTPSGYRFDGPVAYHDGTVTLKFAANGGIVGYDITQKRSTWDSQSVLDNLVAKHSDDYAINSSQGLTVYTYGQNAAWVNHGVLYTLKGDAPLKTEQILKIANSL